MTAADIILAEAFTQALGDLGTVAGDLAFANRRQMTRSDDGRTRYVFRDGSAVVIVPTMNGRAELAGLGYTDPASCFCLVEDGHSCGENDLPPVDPDGEVDFEEEQEHGR